MRPELQAALGTLRTSEEARDALRPGTYAIDELVRVTGTVTIGADYQTTPTVSLPVKEILALFVARAGFTRKHTMQLLVECVSDALAKNGRGAGEIASKVDAVDEYLAAIKNDVLAKLPKVPRRGAVRAKLAVEAVLTCPCELGLGTTDPACFTNPCSNGRKKTRDELLAVA
jgi:hypothetical protein